MRTTDSRHDFLIAANLLERNFIAAAPNQIWLADITYVETAAHDEVVAFAAQLISSLCGVSAGSSTPNGRSAAPRRCWPISAAILIALQ